MSGKKKGKSRSRSRHVARKVFLVALAAAGVLCGVGDWYVHHPREWLEETASDYPRFLTATLEFFGDPTADFTDALDLTGHDAVYEYDLEAPVDEVLFAGTPVRVGSPAPDDIRILDRGEFKIGWSPSLRHPVWVAYHVKRESAFELPDRPNFHKDKSVPECPTAGDYSRSGYDRGHMAPNHAIASRYGAKAQALTFQMSNISPQTPQLNRGVWRQLEHRIADYWTARYGEIWIIVGTISGNRLNEKLSGTEIDIPDAYYQIVVAQEGMDVRALALLYPQDSAWDLWPSRGIVSIDEVERLSGLDFLSELPDFIQTPLEAERPTRLWPVRKLDVLSQLWMRYRR